MLTHLKEEAVAIPDMEERVEFVPGTIRGKQVTAHYILMMYNVLFLIKGLDGHLCTYQYQLISSIFQKWRKSR